MCALDQVGHDASDLAELSSAELTRRQIRSLTFHILYAAESFDYEESLEAIVDNLNRGFDLGLQPTDEAVVVARAIIEARHELDETIKPLLHNWRFDRIGMCTKLILRMALWELQQHLVDHKVVINEAIELAKCFAETDAYKFVNGILDEAIKTMPELQNDQATNS